MRTLLFALFATLLCAVQASAQDLAQARPEADKETESLYSKGETAWQNAAYSEAVSLYTQVLEHDPEHLNARLHRGFCYSIQKEYEKAIADFTAVIERKHDHLWAYTSRGSAYAKMGRQDLAMQDFDMVITMDPKNEEAYNNRGWSKKATGDMAGACKDWKKSKQMGNSEARIILDNNHCK